MYFTDEQRAEIRRQSYETLRLADELLAERRDPDSLENIIPFTRRTPPAPEPEPPGRLTDSQVARLIADMGAQLDEFRQYVSGELSSLLTETFNTVADELDSLHAGMKALQNKAIETDIVNLQSETALLRSDLEKLRQIVEGLAGEVASLRDDVASVERSAKVVGLRKGSP